jgi:Protein of unknown function (DUF2917)
MTCMRRTQPHLCTHAREVILTKSVTTTLVQLHASPGYKIRDGKGTTLHAISGVIWVTQQADRRDIFLYTGEYFLVDQNGLTIVSALGGPAVFAIASARILRPTGLVSSHFDVWM